MISREMLSFKRFLYGLKDIYIYIYVQDSYHILYYTNKIFMSNFDISGVHKYLYCAQYLS